MKILCGTNFDPSAVAAARVACDLAARTNGSLELMHVLASPTLFTGSAKPGTEGSVSLAQALAQQGLDAAAKTLRETSAVPVTTHLDSGPADACLLLRAEETSADLIVMGTASHSRLQRWLQGSVAERVMRLGDHPVLLVPPPESSATSPLREGRAFKILIAIDGRQDCGAYAFARRLRAQAACDIVLLRLYWPVEEYRRLGLTGARDLFQSDPDVVRDLESSIRRHVGDLPGAGSVAIAAEACWGPRADAILSAARAHGCDLIVMGAESRHGLARITHAPVADRMARSASQLPILFLPAEPAPGSSPSPIVTVLAGTDFSEGGDLAARAAYGLLAGHGGVVELCHVHERPLPHPAYSYDEPAGRLDDAARTALEDRLRALVPADAAQHGIVTHVTVIDGGRAATALVQAAERWRVDAMVLGAGSHGATRRALLGSVSQIVARASKRPVVLIPGPSSDA